MHYLLCVSFPGGSDGAMQQIREMWVQSLGWEDPLEEGLATHYSILAWKMPWILSLVISN